MEIRRGVFLPNLFTVGNGVCGFAALIKVLKVQILADPVTGTLSFDHPEYFTAAAVLILVGMVFDVFDGKLARLTGRTSDLGAQLDSLCDLVTFGLAPAVLVVRLNMIYGELWGKAVWFFSLAYFLGALLRLARFNAENEHDESAHLCFKGLPSPGAAGCVASLVLFYRYIMEFSDHELKWIGELVSQASIQKAFGWIPVALPALMLVLGYTMVASHIKYDHVASRIFNRRHSFEFFVSLIFGTVLLALLPEIVLPLIFIGYLASTPLARLWRRMRHGAKANLPETEPADEGGEADDFLQDSPLDRKRD